MVHRCWFIGHVQRHLPGIASLTSEAIKMFWNFFTTSISPWTFDDQRASGLVYESSHLEGKSLSTQSIILHLVLLAILDFDKTQSYLAYLIKSKPKWTAVERSHGPILRVYFIWPGMTLFTPSKSELEWHFSRNSSKQEASLKTIGHTHTPWVLSRDCCIVKDMYKWWRNSSLRRLSQRPSS